MPDAPPLPAPPFLLRPYAAGDEGLYCTLFTDAAVMHWVGPPLAEAHARRAADLALAHQQAAVGLAALTCHHAAGHAAMVALMRRLGFRPVPPRPDVAVPCGWECQAPEAMAAG